MNSAKGPHIYRGVEWTFLKIVKRFRTQHEFYTTFEDCICRTFEFLDWPSDRLVEKSL